MGLYHNCITSSNILNLKPQDMDEFDYKVCKKWLKHNQKIKFSRIFNLVAFILVLPLGFIHPFLLLLSSIPFFTQTLIELFNNSSILADLKRNNCIKRMKELVHYYENIKSKNITIEYGDKNHNKTANHYNTTNKKEMLHSQQKEQMSANLSLTKQRYIEKYLDKIEDCKNLDD